MKLFIGAGMLGVLTLLVSCGPLNHQQPFVVQLDWTHEAEFTGFYVARDQGYFQEAGLRVELVEGPAGTDIPAILRTGRADAALMGMTMYRNTLEVDPDFAVILAILQTSPRVLITSQRLGVRHPRDLLGKTVGIKSPSWGVLVRSIMANAGLPPGQIREIPVKPSEVDRFYRGEIDVWTGFSTGEAVEAQMAGHPVDLIFADDYGAGGYDQLVVVRRSGLERDRERYQRFVRALTRGWDWAVNHGPEVIDLLTRLRPDQPREYHDLVWKALRPLVSTGRNPIGWIDPARWPGGMPPAVNLLELP